jgi:hypothetical protein
MAWNPGPEVAAVRDAANKLKSPFAVIIYMDEKGEGIGMASYGKTMALCAKAGEFGKYLHKAAMKWGEE